MHFHLPKPLHGWRQLAGEVGIIVLGVLIALAAEQAVESAQWAAKARTAKYELHQQMVLAWVFAEEREARHKCADSYLVRLANTLVSSPPQWRPMPADYCRDHHGWVYIPPNRPWPTEVWRSVEAEGTVSHLGESYPRKASFLFDFIKSIGDENNAESTEAAALNALAYPITLTPDSKIEFIKSIERLQYHNDMMTLASQQMQDQIRALGETPTPRELSIVRTQVPHVETDEGG
ncbi:MAG TPA: hypothetical protein VFW39_04955 [Sphingomicrobium sp.]|nr:hypothetical protein [Sphingomicrobium sp.]